MEHNDREYEDVLNKELKGVEPSDELYAKVRDCIARGVVHTRHRKTALGTVAVLVVAIMALSSVTPVFGRNGTLPQVINAMAAERRVQKIAQTLGTATVQQTSAALLIPEATVQAVANSALSKSDGILALVIADCAGKSAGDVVALRIQGFGWGVIMAQLGISGRDISGAVGQAQAVASANTPPAPSQGNVPSGQPAVSNKAGDKVVANGEITVASPTSLTVAGTTFAIVTDTQMKYHGKAITPGDLVTKFLAGKLSATIQGTQLADTSLCANLVIVQDGATDVPSTPPAVTPSIEQPKANNERQARGTVVIVTSTVLRVEGYAYDIILNAATKVEQVGAGESTLADIKAGQTVQVQLSVSGSTYTAMKIHIEDKPVKAVAAPTPRQENGTTPDQPAVSNKAGDKVVANGEITVASPTSLTVAGTTFAIVTDTQMKYHGKAITPGDLVTKFLAGKLSATIQGTQLADTSLCANLVIVQDVPENEQHEQTQQQEQNSLIRTWQGTIIVVFPPAGSDLGSVLVGGQVGQPVLYRMTSTSVLQGTKENGGHYTLTMEALQALATTSPQAVTIQGTLLADGTVEIFKLTITTVNTTAASGPMNPGRGNGTDKPGKN